MFNTPRSKLIRNFACVFQKGLLKLLVTVLNIPFYNWVRDETHLRLDFEDWGAFPYGAHSFNSKALA